MIEVLLCKVKAGDNLGCGTVTAEIVAGFENLPKLRVEEGTTNEGGGDFDSTRLDSTRLDTRLGDTTVQCTVQ